MAVNVKKVARRALVGLVVVLGVLQFANPPRSNPPVVSGHDLLATNPPPERIVAQLRAACYDCHSNETEWPWYSRVAPISWWIAHHVEDGRKHLNFSEWPHDRLRRARSLWQNIRDEVEAGDMPLPSFTWAHPEARLSAADRQALAEWADQEAARISKLMAAEESE